MYFVFIPGYYSKFLNVYNKTDHPFIITLVNLNIVFPIAECIGICLSIIAIQ